MTSEERRAFEKQFDAWADPDLKPDRELFRVWFERGLAHARKQQEAQAEGSRERFEAPVVGVDPVMEAIARKLHGITNVPSIEQDRMIRAAAKAGSEACERQRTQAGTDTQQKGKRAPERVCRCEACQRDRMACTEIPQMSMPICPECGDKRCPKAKDHHNLCGRVKEGEG